MKKITLLLLMLVSSVTYGQLFTVAQCNSLGSNTYGPMYSIATANASSRTAVIYPASQIIGLAGQDLSSIYFDRANAGAMVGSPNFKVYLKEVNEADFGAGDLDWATAIASATLVYDSNPINAVGTDTGWKSFDFSTNFTYSGSGNLAVFMEYKNSEASVSVTWMYEYSGPCITTANSNTTKYANNTTGTLAPVLTSTNYRRPIIAFDYTVSCPALTGLVASNVTSSTADLDWIAGGTETQWEYAVLATGAPAPASGIIISASEFLLTDLAPATAYTAYVRSVCGTNDTSVWKTVSFLTQCVAVTTLPWTENFDGLASVGTNSFPPCWLEENGDWATANAITRNTPRSGANYLRNSWLATNEYIWTPGFELVAGTSYDFSTFVQGDNYTGWVVDMFYNNEQTSVGATQLGASYNVPGASATGPSAIVDYVEMRRTFVPTTSGVYTFAIRVNQPSGSPWYVAFDDFRVETTPSCAAPNTIDVAVLSPTSASVSWVQDGATTSWNVEYGAPGFTLGTGTLVNTTANPLVLEGLASSTSYSVYVQAICADGLSSWGGPAAFTTPCTFEVAPTTVETFSTYVPLCWSEATGALETSSSVNYSATSEWGTVNGFGNAGTDKAAKINLYGGSTANPNNDWIISNSIDLGTTPDAFQLSYKMAVTSYNGTTAQSTLGSHIVRVVVSTDNGETWSTANVLRTYTGAAAYSATGTTEILPLTGYTGLVRIGFLATTTSLSPDIDFHIDNFVVEAASDCQAPNNLVATSITQTTATLNWSELGTSSTWTLEYGLEGFVEGAGTTVTVTSIPFVLENLTPNTTYEFAVQSFCGAVFTDFSSRATFTTLPVAPDNDNCAGAVALTVNNDLDCGVVTSSSTFGATNSMPSGACFGNPNDDVWFTFVASATEHEFTLSNIVAVTGTSVDLYLQVLSGSCADTQISVDCSDNDTDTITGLTVGETYYVRVYTYFSTSTASFDLCIGTDPLLSTNNFNVSKFSYSPNPVRDELMIKNATSIKEVVVYNMLGQQVMLVKPNASETSVNMSQLPAGTYVLKASTDDTTETFKIQKQ